MLLHAGIGATPCLSVLGDLVGAQQAGSKLGYAQNVLLVWTSREVSLFYEFRGLLTDAQAVFGEGSVRLFSSTTAEKDSDLPELSIAISRSRPDVSAILDEAVGWARDSPSQSGGGRYYGNRRVGVFACGPEPLLDSVSGASRRHADVIHIHKEVFAF